MRSSNKKYLVLMLAFLPAFAKADALYNLKCEQIQPPGGFRGDAPVTVETANQNVLWAKIDSMARQLNVRAVNGQMSEPCLAAFDWSQNIVLSGDAGHEQDILGVKGEANSFILAIQQSPSLFGSASSGGYQMTGKLTLVRPNGVSYGYELRCRVSNSGGTRRSWSCKD